MSVVTASQVNKIGFVSLVVCFDLPDPKFLLSARQLKKGAFATPNWSKLVMKRYKMKEMEEHKFLKMVALTL